MPSPPVTADCARTALFLDVDGTLLEIRDRPEDVVADAGLVDLLETLSSAFGGALSLISGRGRPGRRALTGRSRYNSGVKTLPIHTPDPDVHHVELHPEVIAERLEKAAEAIGDPTRVMAGTDCGFDTSAGMGRVTADVVWAKLRAMREGADLAAKRLL